MSLFRDPNAFDSHATCMELYMQRPIDDDACCSCQRRKEFPKCLKHDPVIKRRAQRSRLIGS